MHFVDAEQEAQHRTGSERGMPHAESAHKELIDGADHHGTGEVALGVLHGPRAIPNGFVRPEDIVGVRQSLPVVLIDAQVAGHG